MWFVVNNLWTLALNYQQPLLLPLEKSRRPQRSTWRRSVYFDTLKFDILFCWLMRMSTALSLESKYCGFEINKVRTFLGGYYICTFVKEYFLLFFILCFHVKEVQIPLHSLEFRVFWQTWGIPVSSVGCCAFTCSTNVLKAVVLTSHK